jgi:adenylate kinase family enzyme
MSYIFISGIPASGKSYLAGKLAKKTGAYHLKTDDLRKEMSKDPKLKPWVDFYFNLDEKEYYETKSCEDLWENLVNQSEAFWPYLLKRFEELKEKYPSIILEGVNILPHLAKKNLNFLGVFLLGESEEIIFERNKKDPRWGNTEELQRLEAKIFFNCEGKYYKKEAEKYGYKTFNSADVAEEYLIDLIKN